MLLLSLLPDSRLAEQHWIPMWQTSIRQSPRTMTCRSVRVIQGNRRIAGRRRKGRSSPLVRCADIGLLRGFLEEVCHQ
jgi:hypothetical protein